eukprot:jgi/Mesen1/9188/ME000591S08515
MAAISSGLARLLPRSLATVLSSTSTSCVSPQCGAQGSYLQEARCIPGVVNALSGQEKLNEHRLCLRGTSTVDSFSCIARQSSFGNSTPSQVNRHTRTVPFAAKKKRFFDDPFDYGEDPEMQYGSLMSSGRQDAQEPRPPTDPDSKDGYLLFPKGYNLEIASLGLYIRGDVRNCALVVSGGVYENLLFFPVIQLLKEKYPGVRIDIVATARGKQTYELNKNVRRAWVYDVDEPMVVPADYTDMLGKLKNECYDMVLSTRQAGMGHAMFLFMTDARQRIAYVIPNANGAGAGMFLSTSIRTETVGLAQRGYNMYQELVDELCQATIFADALGQPVPLSVGVPGAVKLVARGNLSAAGVKPGHYTVIHGLESDSAACMRSAGDPDSQLSAKALAEVAKSIEGEVLVVIPNEIDRPKVVAAFGPDARILRVTTPGQLAATIEDSAGVVTTNTAALLLSMALKKPSVALFGSVEKAKLFAPHAESHNCTVVASSTGKLADVDLSAAAAAVKTLAASEAVPALAF